MRLRRYAPSGSSTYFEYASGALGRKPCIHIRLDLLATNPCEKCGLTSLKGSGLYFLYDIDFYDIADFYIGETLEADAAFKAGSHFGNVLFETP